MRSIPPIVSLVFLAACSTAGAGGGSPSALAGTTWRLATLQSSQGAVTPDDPSKYEMTLAADGSMAIRLDCNRGAGTWKSEAAGQIAFPPFALSNAACLGPSLDTRVARELGSVRTYALAGDRLTLNTTDGGNQVWTRAAASP